MKVDTKDGEATPAACSDSIHLQLFLSSAEQTMNRLPKSLIAAVAVVAVIGILFVLITPAPDELPSTGPHSLTKLFVPVSHSIYWSDSPLFASRVEVEFLVVFAGIDRLSLTCIRLC